MTLLRKLRFRLHVIPSKSLIQNRSANSSQPLFPIKLVLCSEKNMATLKHKF